MFKKKFITIISIFILNGQLFSQVTLILQPGASTGQDAYVWDYNPNTNYGTAQGLDVTAWTASGTPYISRAFVNFDLSSIPNGAFIISANLSLYYNNTMTNYSGVHSGANESFLRRVTSAWQQNTVTWNNQPSTTSINEINLPATTSGTQDFTNIDVTDLVADMINNPATSFGFMLKLQTEQYYRDLIFASSNHSNAALHPKLEVIYDTAITCETLQPGAEGKDAFVWDYYPSTNYGNSDALDVTAWTASGTPYVSRVFINFDVNFIPANANILSARLSLYHNNTTTNYNGVHSGANESLLQRVTSSWQENNVTWTNQPNTTMVNAVSLPATISGTEDFININVKNLVIDMINNPTSSFGFMLRLQTEQIYRDLIFASGEHANSALHPKLVVCYIVPSGFIQSEKKIKICLYPNPVNTSFIFQLDDDLSELNDIFIYNDSGRKVFEKINCRDNQIKIDKKNFCEGIYFAKILNDRGATACIKFIVQ